MGSLDNSIGKIWHIMFGIILTVILILVPFTQKIDNSIQSKIDYAAQKFSDECRLTGYISPSNYQNFIDSVCLTGYVYKINLKHESEYAYPDDDENYSTHYQVYNTQDILNTMYPDNNNPENYVMKDGDYFQVSIDINSPSMSQQFISAITGRAVKDIHGNYGGYVGNTLR